MKFTEAVEQLKSGNKIRRKAWAKESFMLITNNEIKHYIAGVREFIFDTTIILSDDWVIDSMTDGFTFSQVVEALMKGSKAKLSHWADTYIYFNPTSRQIERHYLHEHQHELISDDVIASDWEIIP